MPNPPTVIGAGDAYDPQSDSWTPISMQGDPTPRISATVVWTGSQMIVWGGETINGGVALGTGGVYSSATDAWQSTATPNEPSPRLFHTAVWTGQGMIVWGGSSTDAEGADFGDGAIYYP